MPRKKKPDYLSGNLHSGHLVFILTGFSSKNSLHSLRPPCTFGLAENRAFGCLLLLVLEQGAPAVFVHGATLEIFPAAFLAHRFDGLSCCGVF